MTKIAIADDSVKFRNGLKELLLEIGNVDIIIEADDGEKLIQELKLKKPDLIFMDIEMPNMNGFEATKKIVAQYPNIKIYGMSGYEKDKFIQKLIDSGAHGYLTKNSDNFEVIKQILIQKDIDSFVYSDNISENTPLLKSDKTVIVVDKFENKLLSLRHYLRKCGYSVLKANNSAEAIKYFETHKINAAIVDESITDDDENFSFSILQVSDSLKLFLISRTYKRTDITKKDKHQIIELENNFSTETIVRIIEN